MSEWVLRWRGIFEQQLCLRGENARSFMADMHTKLIYLNTDLTPVPRAVLTEIADYTGLPCEVLFLDLDPLRAAVAQACGRISRRASC